MRMLVFSIHDTAIKAFAQPFFMATEAAAIRAFTSLVNDPASQLNQSPGDYTLHQLAAFDDTSGIFSGTSKQIAQGIAVYNNRLAEPPGRPVPAELQVVQS